MPATLTPTPLTWQGSLFGTGTPRADASFHAAVRTQLDATAWVDVVPGWLAGADELFTTLLKRLAWKSNEMPMYGQLVRQPRLERVVAARRRTGAPAAVGDARRGGRTALRRDVRVDRRKPLPRRARQRRLARRPPRPGTTGPRRGDPRAVAGEPPPIPAPPTGRWPIDRPPAGRWRPARDGWCLPARLAPQRAEDGPRATTHEHHLPLRHSLISDPGRSARASRGRQRTPRSCRRWRSSPIGQRLRRPRRRRASCTSRTGPTA